MSENKLTDDLQSILDQVNEVHGSDAAMTMTGTSGLWPMDKRAPTGSLELDLAIGVGGWPRGRVSVIAGEESSGKTTLCLMTAALAQSRGENVFYIDAESALNPDWAAKIGVNLGHMLVAQPSSLENAIDTAVTAINTGKVHLLVFDSIPALKSKIVMEADAETETRALEARRWSSQFPKVMVAAREHNVTVLMINQVRDSMSMYVAESMPGGRTIKFGSSCTVRLKKTLEGRQNDDGVDYAEASFTIIKNKQGSPYKKGNFVIWTKNDKPIQPELDCFYAALSHELIVEDHKWDEDQEDIIKKKGWFTLTVNPDDEEMIALIREYHDEDFDAPGLSAYRAGKMRELFLSIPGLPALVADRLMQTLNRNAILEVDSSGESELDYDPDSDNNAEDEDGED